MEALPLRAGGEMDAIIDRYQGAVYGLALARTGSRSDADDVFQEEIGRASCRERV